MVLKLARFNGGRIGCVIDGTLRDVTDAAGIDPGFWPPIGVVKLVESFDGKRERLLAAAQAAAPIAIDSVRLENPMPWPNKLIAIPVNYHAHALEMSSPAISKNGGFFIKSASSLSGAGEPVLLPDLPGRAIHHEAELAVIIGRRCRHVARDQALDYVFGYGCLLDMTVRGKQERAIRKSYDTFTPLGPWITTADEVPDPAALRVQLWVNDELRQDALTRDMIVDVPEIIAMCSSVMTLEPGDVIATGTAEGVGPVVPGDTITIDITPGVGRMSVAVQQGEGGWNIAIPHRV
ncbi:fumarylacetoacetate hydrolase family protein [Candidimonas nitroreducens]|uniref:fumarylacetoacetate hydrolase family protein n=1 Tax=Candidimonas nitroreducens TaxID=683354 RepID=UPI001E3D9110|nr:fumarylacetoacetate hydrolase family protein [Candidimonas nitroreducens]